MAWGRSSLRGLSVLAGDRDRGGGRPSPAQPDSDLSGNDLQQAGLDRFEQQLRDNVEQHRVMQEAVGDPHADWNASDEAIMASSGRGPAWAAFFGLMNGKRLAGFGHEGFQAGRIAPGTSDVIEPIGPSYDARDFTSGTIGPGSIAGRSGLSQQALRLLAGGGR